MGRLWDVPTNVPSGLKDSSGQSADAEVFKEKLRLLFKQAAEHLQRVNQPVMPSQFPVAAMVALKAHKGQGQKTPVLVYRTYAGIEAVNMENGSRVGYVPINGGFDWFMKPERESFLNQWNGVYMGNPLQGQPALRPGIVFENTTIGALSTDGDFVYTVEDLVEPPPSIYAQQQMMGFVGNPNINNWPQDIMKAVGHSRLWAFDLTRGCAMAWDLPVEGDDKSQFADSYFLGPPLCLNGKLYVLTEKQQELRLVCLENVKHGSGWTAKVDFMLSLGTARDSQMQQDPLRRIHAAHLSYGDGVLVCPTNLGYVIGIDLLQNSLLWAYPYRDKTDVPEEPAGPMVMGPGGMPMRIRGGWVPSGTYNQSPPQSGWKVSAPIIQDGKVVFTATDSKSIHCVRLKDGTPVWSRPRQENDLFLGGVVNGKVIIVGTKTVHAYTLAKGDDAWTVETGLPSGFGAASDNTYYLPLQKSIASKEPEICAIDVDRGIITGHTKARAVKDGAAPEAPAIWCFSTARSCRRRWTR